MYTYNGAVAAGYLDGHATGRDTAELGWRPASARTGIWFWTATFQSQDAAKAPWFLRQHANGFWNAMF